MKSFKLESSIKAQGRSMRDDIVNSTGKMSARGQQPNLLGEIPILFDSGEDSEVIVQLRDELMGERAKRVELESYVKEIDCFLQLGGKDALEGSVTDLFDIGKLTPLIQSQNDLITSQQAEIDRLTTSLYKVYGQIDHNKLNFQTEYDSLLRNYQNLEFKVSQEIQLKSIEEHKYSDR